MPHAALRPCSKPGCPELVGSGRCAKHRAQQWAQADEQRKSSGDRGYDARWQRFRAEYIRRVVSLDPFCSDCRGTFNRTSEIELHHVKKLADGGAKYDDANIRHLCHGCHSTRTRLGE